MSSSNEESRCAEKFQNKIGSSNEDIDYWFMCRVRSVVYSISVNILKGVGLCIPRILYLHFIGKEVLGICYVRLPLLYTTILFSRRAFIRNRMVKRFPEEDNCLDNANFLWLLVPTVAVFSCVFCFFWLGNWNWLELPSEEYIQDYQFAVKILGLSCVIEALAEPAAYTLPISLIPWNVLMALDKFRFFIKSSIVVVAVQYFPEHVIRATAYGELAMAIVRLAVLWMLFLMQLRKKAELANNGNLLADNPLAELSFPCVSGSSLRNVFSCQLFIDGKPALHFLHMLRKGAIAEILERGEHYVMTLVPGVSFAEQGIYDTISDLGRSIVYGVFLPLRSQSFVYYARVVSPFIYCEEKTADNLKKISTGLFKFLRITVRLGYSMFIFGFSYSPLISKSYAGSLFDDWPGPLLMKTQWLIVFLKGLNEVTEAYAVYSMGESYMEWHEMMLTNLTLVRLLILGVLIQFVGSIGFSLTNCVMFGFLVLHKLLWFIRRDFEDIFDIPEKPLRGLFLNRTEAFAFAAALLLTACSAWLIYPYSTILHLAFGIISVALLTGVIIFTKPGGLNIVHYFLGHHSGT